MPVVLSAAGAMFVCPHQRGRGTKCFGMGWSCPDALYLSFSHSGFHWELFQAKELKTQTRKERRAPVKNLQLFFASRNIWP